MVDPGMYGAGEQTRMQQYLTAEGLTPVAVLITHSHIDHVCGLDWVKEHYPAVPVYGMAFAPLDEAAATLFTNSGWEVPTMIATPGHKEDCVCFYFPAERVLFSGDTLFQESVGRTDLEGGDTDTLLRSLQTLMQLPEETTVYPGHAYPTTIGHEKRYNPYI